jgi:predicted nucleic acid-binding protein
MAFKRERFGVDSSCIIALVSDWHIHHRITLHCYGDFLSRGALPVMESFSVLTRLPVPYRILPGDAHQLLEQTFAGKAMLAPLAPETAWEIMGALAAQHLGGGRIYDAAIAASVAAAGASVLLTWNHRDFIPISPTALDIREPSANRD